MGRLKTFILVFIPIYLLVIILDQFFPAIYKYLLDEYGLVQLMSTVAFLLAGLIAFSFFFLLSGIKPTGEILVTSRPGILVTILWLAFLEGVGVILTLIALPADSKHAVFLGFSLYRWIMLGGAALTCGSIGFAAISLRRWGNKTQAVYARIVSFLRASMWRWLTISSSGMLVALAGLIFLGFISFGKNSAISADLLRLTPWVIWITLSSVQLLVAINQLEWRPISPYAHPVQSRMLVCLAGGVGLIGFLEELDYGKDLIRFSDLKIGKIGVDSIHAILQVGIQLVLSAFYKQPLLSSLTLLSFVLISGYVVYIKRSILRTRITTFWQTISRKTSSYYLLLCIVLIVIATFLDLGLFPNSAMVAIEETMELQASIAVLLSAISLPPSNKSN